MKKLSNWWSEISNYKIDGSEIKSVTKIANIQNMCKSIFKLKLNLWIDFDIDVFDWHKQFSIRSALGPNIN